MRLTPRCTRPCTLFPCTRLFRSCLVAASQATRGDAAFLFGSDEEANDARCIEAFLKRQHGFSSVVVAEPTDGEAVLAHRGISSVLLRFKGQRSDERRVGKEGVSTWRSRW